LVVIDGIRILLSLPLWSSLFTPLIYRSPPPLCQPLSPLSQHYRPLLAAAVSGFLTRRLLRTERVAQLVRTIRVSENSIVKPVFSSTLSFVVK